MELGKLFQAAIWLFFIALEASSQQLHHLSLDSSVQQAIGRKQLNRLVDADRLESVLSKQPLLKALSVPLHAGGMEQSTLDSVNALIVRLQAFASNPGISANCALDLAFLAETLLRFAEAAAVEIECLLKPVNCTEKSAAALDQLKSTSWILKGSLFLIQKKTTEIRNNSCSSARRPRENAGGFGRIERLVARKLGGMLEHPSTARIV